MDNFKKASKEKLRFATTKGNLSVEQLWDLSLTELDNLAVSLEADYKTSAKKSFLDTKTEKDKITKLKFDVALEVLTTKVEEAEAERKKREDKEHNNKILGLIAEKKDEALKGKSVKQLEEMLR